MHQTNATFLSPHSLNSQDFNMKETSLYFHIPFCRKKCLYCDFFTAGSSIADWHLFVDASLAELSQRKDELSAAPDTLYIGGGTPSLLPPEEFVRLVDGIREITGVPEFREFTIEVNPEDVSEDICRVWQDCGVNRISMGIQSFDDTELEKVGRLHSGRGAIDAYLKLRRHFDNVNIDLMFGLPGQTLGSWMRTIEKANVLNPDHISAYSLMFERGTAITVLKGQGRMSFPAEKTCVDMFNMLSSELDRHGYIRYEISNYARKGKESIHNSRYWLGNPYLGIGPAAHSYDGKRTRRYNPTNLKGYLSRFRKGSPDETMFFQEEVLNDEELAEEMILTRMRMREGLSVEEYESRFGGVMKERLLANADKFIKTARLICSDGRLRLSQRGIMIADEVILGLSM